MRRACATLFVLMLVWPMAASAQEVTLSMGDGGGLALRSVQLMVLLTVLSLVPGLLIMVTCFFFAWISGKLRGGAKAAASFGELRDY